MSDSTNPKTSSEQTLQLTLPASTAHIVVDALDLYSRVGLGQLDEISSLARFGLLTNADGEPPSEDALYEAEAYLKQTKRALFGFESSASHGIFSPKVNDRFRTAWGVLKAIRHRLAWDRTPTGGIQVSFDEPMREECALGVKVSSKAAEEFLEELPEGVLLTRYGKGWAVVRLHATDRVLQVVSESHSPQTAIQMAKNSTAGPKRDTF
jgi:hypothetical protein